ASSLLYLHNIQRALERLSNSDRLRIFESETLNTEGTNPSNLNSAVRPIERLAEKNRRLFSPWLLLSIPICSFLIVVCNELESFYDCSIGYVQSWYTTTWASYKDDGHPKKKMTLGDTLRNKNVVSDTETIRDIKVYGCGRTSVHDPSHGADKPGSQN